ncbi:MAG: hypothetical protein ACRER2_09835, partial [Methylococcales bacterium]
EAAGLFNGANRSHARPPDFEQDFRAAVKRGLSGTRRPRPEVTNEPCRHHQPTAFRDGKNTLGTPFALT